MQLIFVGIITILSILGFAEIVRLLVFRMLKLPEDKLYFLAVLDDPESTENTLRSVTERFSWMNIPAKLVFICENEESAAIADKFLGENSNIDLLSREDLVYNIKIRDNDD